MALGRLEIHDVMNLNEKIIKNLDWGAWDGTGIYGTWNTFQYVAKNLGVWADETTIGAEVKQTLAKLSDALYSLMEQTNKLNSKIEKFTGNQKELNGIARHRRDVFTVYAEDVRKYNKI